jgi:hypothetical protein
LKISVAPNGATLPFMDDLCERQCDQKFGKKYPKFVKKVAKKAKISPQKLNLNFQHVHIKPLLETLKQVMF